jgi:hypothetical protein
LGTERQRPIAPVSRIARVAWITRIAWVTRVTTKAMIDHTEETVVIEDCSEVITSDVDNLIVVPR